MQMMEARHAAGLTLGEARGPTVSDSQITVYLVVCAALSLLGEDIDPLFLRCQDAFS